MEAKPSTKLKNDEGALILGGATTPLQGETPFKKVWGQIKDGDLWEQFQNTVEAKGPKWVKLRKAKGHATDEMVDEGKVERHEKLGNDKADVNAGKSATEEDKRLNYFA